jgi:hypothetical protein
MAREKDLWRFRKEEPPLSLKPKEFVKDVKEERLDNTR